MVDVGCYGPKHGLTKVPIQDLQGISNGSQIYLVVPGQQKPRILLNLGHLLLINGDVKFS
jgi:hypothetical protein